MTNLCFGPLGFVDQGRYLLGTVLYAQLLEPIERGAAEVSARIGADKAAVRLLDRFLGIKSAAACGIYCTNGMCYTPNAGCSTQYYWYCHNYCLGTQGWMCMPTNYGCPYNGLCLSQC